MTGQLSWQPPALAERGALNAASAHQYGSSDSLLMAMLCRCRERHIEYTVSTAVSTLITLQHLHGVSDSARLRSADVSSSFYSSISSEQSASSRKTIADVQAPTFIVCGRCKHFNIIVTAVTSRHLRSANQHQLIVPRCRRITFGHRAFSVVGPTVWNSLPTKFRSLSVSFGDFRRTLKTRLFARYQCTQRNRDASHNIALYKFPILFYSIACNKT